MRASKSVKREALSVKSKKSQNSKAKIQNSNREIHISGAEGLYELPEVDRIAADYFLRAMSHPKGMPDKVVITIEKIEEKPLVVPVLGISTMKSNSPAESQEKICELLSDAGVSPGAIRKGLKAVAGDAVMHGAALISSGSATRMEPDRKRGIRVSRLGIARDFKRKLSGKLTKNSINTATVKEAIILASKVASCRDIVAELCISDDPDYTTGYVASRKLGYVRIPNIKKKGSSSGGRVFFIKDGADIEGIVEYLEKRPVIVGM